MPIRAVTHLSRLKGHARQHRPFRLSASKQGYDRWWQKVRRIQLFKQPLCERCKAWGLTVVGTQVDHIIPKRLGGTDEESNLQTLCASCHSKKTMLEKWKT